MSTLADLRYVSERVIRSGSLLFELDVQNMSAPQDEVALACLVGQTERQPSESRSGCGTVLQPSSGCFLQALFTGDGSSSLLPRSTIQVSYSSRERAALPSTFSGCYWSSGLSARRCKASVTG